MDATKAFYRSVLGWEFTDYGRECFSFMDGRLADSFFVATGIQPGGPPSFRSG